jgi:hypothetical protein
MPHHVKSPLVANQEGFNTIVLVVRSYGINLTGCQCWHGDGHGTILLVPSSREFAIWREKSAQDSYPPQNITITTNRSQAVCLY